MHMLEQPVKLLAQSVSSNWGSVGRIHGASLYQDADRNLRGGPPGHGVCIKLVL